MGVNKLCHLQHHEELHPPRWPAIMPWHNWLCTFLLFRSYLSDRFHTISINIYKSYRHIVSPHPHPHAWGAVLGSLLCRLPLGYIKCHHRLQLYHYTNNTLLYFTPAILSTLTTCLLDMKTWINSNSLKPICKKSGIIIIQNPQNSVKTHLLDKTYTTRLHLLLPISSHSLNLSSFYLYFVFLFSVKHLWLPRKVICKLYNFLFFFH